MKRFRLLLAMLLTLAMLFSIAAFTSAEVQTEDEWRADISALMKEENIPKGTSIEYDYNLPEDAQPESHAHSIEKIGSDGSTMRMDIGLISLNEMTKEEWSIVDDWLDEVVSAAIQGIAADSESMAKAVSSAILKAKKNAQPDEEGVLPVWADENVMLDSIDVVIPYYPELSTNVNGTATEKLQKELARLGFLAEEADGYFGSRTAAAVEMLEEYVRELEQAAIDARPTPAPSATPVPEMTMPTDVLLTEVTPEPEPTPAPIPQPTPETPVDGIADALLLAYLYSDDFVEVREELAAGDKGIDVRRIQNRLKLLGYMTDAADGDYGSSTSRSVRIFQYYNGVEPTGAADIATQELLFSDDAQAPDNSMLSVGSKGDDVKTLQKRLRILGFMNASADGHFGSSTENGVRTLQQYMRDLEEAKLSADETVMAEINENGGDVKELLSVDVNGIADPMILDDFYADTFPAIPETMKNGSNGIDVVRVQRRLKGLEYYYGALDGDYGNGTENAIRSFQKRHGLERSGIATQETLSLLFSEDAKKALKPYVLKISTKDQRVYAYGLDSNNEHTVLVRTMKCSTGKDETPTPKGTFQNATGPGARWHYFKKFECWAQYAYYIQGDIMFHSVLYNEKNGPVTQSSVNNLGRKASHGCVRLSVEDAKWIYENCPSNTKIIVE